MSICIHHELNRLAAYGLKAGLFEKEDLAFVKNQFLLLLNLDGFENDDEVAAVPEVEISDLEDILKNILDYAVAHNLVGGDGTVYRDLFDTRLMSVMVDRPANIIRKFNELYAESPKKATDFFYKLSQDSDYIRRYRVCKDLKWVSKTQYGDMDITI
ncbi:MAG: galactose-1-phosphate uridylyltransferase, partial [Treponema sp.]|nr:galactose-1-phosphate uridylyltransferase [Treponema sp.]